MCSLPFPISTGNRLNAVPGRAAAGDWGREVGREPDRDDGPEYIPDRSLLEKNSGLCNVNTCRRSDAHATEPRVKHKRVAKRNGKQGVIDVIKH